MRGLLRRDMLRGLRLDWVGMRLFELVGLRGMGKVVITWF